MYFLKKRVKNVCTSSLSLSACVSSGNSLRIKLYTSVLVSMFSGKPYCSTSCRCCCCCNCTLKALARYLGLAHVDYPPAKRTNERPPYIPLDDYHRSSAHIFCVLFVCSTSFCPRNTVNTQWKSLEMSLIQGSGNNWRSINNFFDKHIFSNIKVSLVACPSVGLVAAHDNSRQIWDSSFYLLSYLRLRA